MNIFIFPLIQRSLLVNLESKKQMLIDNEVWKALADLNRREILELLLDKDLTPSEIQRHFEISQPALSSHLRILRNSNLVTQERKGQNILYSINDKKILQASMYLSKFKKKSRFVETISTKMPTSLKESIDNKRLQHE